ncbi:MAG: hypothetical protein ACE5K0_05530 [Candidatus Methanofastidiosia archaeon]
MTEKKFYFKKDKNLTVNSLVVISISLFLLAVFSFIQIPHVKEFFTKISKGLCFQEASKILTEFV